MCMARDQSQPTRECTRPEASSSLQVPYGGAKGLVAAQPKDLPSPKSPADSWSVRSESPTEEENDKEDRRLRMREFLLIYVTYMTFLACRRNCERLAPSLSRLSPATPPARQSRSPGS